MNHDEQRELELQKLCSAVINANPSFYDNPNGGYENTCPFCGNISYGQYLYMNDIVHELGCAYLIAKDLSTNIKTK